MKLGIVGLPNVGKSTLFNAITNAGVAADNYAFCTIDPNVGVVPVPDKRLEWLRDQHNPKKFTPAVIEFVDIAGLVKGASKGEGLGNKFLSNIRGCDAIVHVVIFATCCSIFMGKLSYATESEERTETQFGGTVCINQSVSQQDAILIMLKNNLFLQQYATHSVKRCRHFVTIEFSNVLMSFRAEVITLVLM